ncbi:hypothetical protein [Flavobacterium sp. 3-210]
MALDFHRLDNDEYLFSLDDYKYNCLEIIFESYKNWTGIFIDQYSDNKLTIENQKTLIQIIDIYIKQTNLNLDKEKTIAIIEFRGLLFFSLNKNCDLKILGD